MEMSLPHQVPYKNQLQFNLGVPLSAQNLAVQFSRPSPIFIERLGGHHGIPVNVYAKEISDHPKNSTSPSFNYSSLSEDRMEIMSQLAKRDLRNRRLQSQKAMESPGFQPLSPASSPSRTHLLSKRPCEKHERQGTNRSQKPLTAKEADKNRRFGAVQTPPPRKPLSHFRAGDDSVVSNRNTSMSRESDVYFPAKPVLLEGVPVPKDEIEKLQQEMEGYLSLIECIVEKAISEPGAMCLQLPAKGKQKDDFLAKEESPDRVRIRVDEQNTRLMRNVYNLKQKVKQVQRDVAYADLNKPAKKSQITPQLGLVHRGAAKALQIFVTQLPHQDLKHGLPSQYHELALLLRQLTALSALSKQGRQSDADTKLLAVLDRVDNLNTKWCLELKKSEPIGEKKGKKLAPIKDWISDTKVDRNIFAMKNQPEAALTKTVSHLPRQPLRQQMMRGRPKKRSSGKENRKAGTAFSEGKDKGELRSTITSLLLQNADAHDSVPHPTYNSISKGAEKGRMLPDQECRKGYLLPHDLIAKREEAQRAVAASFKKSQSRPSSAPENVSRQKGVNFDLDRQSPVPWIPPGRLSRSRSLSSERRSRSPSYLRDMGREEFGHTFPDRHIPKIEKAEKTVPDYGFYSLPSEKTLRSIDVSSSFIDEVEHRLLQRLLGRAAAEHGKTSGSNATYYKKRDVSADFTRDLLSDDDGPLETIDLEEAAREKAVSLVQAPTLENMKIRLAEMQREQREIRQRWSTIKFIDTKTRSRKFTSGEIQSEIFHDPPAIEVKSGPTTRRQTYLESCVSEWQENPLIFTKPKSTSVVNCIHMVDQGTLNCHQTESFWPQIKLQKKLITIKPGVVKKISAARDRYESYLRNCSHHPSGKFDPWKLVEEISDEIFADCIADVASEVELISEDIANHMYKSEFMLEKSQLEPTLHRQHSISPQGQPMEDHVTYHYKNFIPKEPSELKNVSQSEENHPTGKGVVLGSVDQVKINEEKSQAHITLSSLGKLAHLNTEKQSPVQLAIQPLLDDVSQLLHHREEVNEERADNEIGEKDEDYEDDYEEETNEGGSDDDGDDYDDDNTNDDEDNGYENVTDDAKSV